MEKDTAHMPDAGRMRACAQAFAERLRRGSRLPLDYSVASLRVADGIVQGLQRGGAEGKRLESALFGIGAYVGEVLVRRAGAVWVDLDAREREMFGQVVGVRMPDGRVWNPLGRVVNRYTGGPEESLHLYYLTLHGRARPTTPAT